MTSYDVLSVSALNRYIKSTFDSNEILKSIYIKGEISNFRLHTQSGHCYFSLKDEKSSIKAIAFRNVASRLRFNPENDMSVIARGRVTVYEATGEYSLYVDDMQPDGAGALAIAFEQLKKKLEAKGIFAQEHKKPIPKFPERVGVVTSESGAAFQDIINVISRRYPLTEIIISPTLVQGAGAAEQIATSIKLFNDKKAADVLIVGRGGGSAEDLWCFNEEIVAMAVYESEIPIISAVGHETDFSICDFASDLRAPTPSAAAELAVPDIRDIYNTVNSLNIRGNIAIDQHITNLENKLSILSQKLETQNPTNYINNLSYRCDTAFTKLENFYEKFLTEKQNTLSLLAARLDASSPIKILSKGYALVTKKGETVKSVSSLAAKDKIDVRLNDGTVECEVL